MRQKSGREGAALLADDLRRIRDARRTRVGLGKLLKAADSAFNYALRSKLAAHDITFSQFQHLQNLWRDDGINQTELSNRIGITIASSTSVLNALETKKLIRRVRNDADRRSATVFLTVAGADLEDALEPHAVDVNVQATKGMTETEVKTLHGLLGRVIANF
jgi:DNA-binding MarR family transcriptional regulator